MDLIWWIIAKFKESPLEKQKETFAYFQREPELFKQMILINLEDYAYVFVMEEGEVLIIRSKERTVDDIFDEFQKYFNSKEFQLLLS